MDGEYYLPPEWTRQTAVWLSWPSNPALWPGVAERIPAFFANFAAAIAAFEDVRICAAAEKHDAIRALLAAEKTPSERVELYDIPTDDVWCRDHGPLFLKRVKTGALAVSDWRFNAWGGKYAPYDKDDAVPARIAAVLELPRFPHSEILEGGAIEANGDRLLMTTRSVLRNPNRGWPNDEAAIEAVLKSELGARAILWLDGGLVGDDTDGHIDNIARFASDDTIIAAACAPNAPSFRTLADNWQKLSSMKTARGDPFRLVALPLPDEPVRAPDGRVLPASYANYLLVNGALLMPTFAQPSDERARAILADVFPHREIVGVDCRDVLVEGGALHCLSQQQPL